MKVWWVVTMIDELDRAKTIAQNAIEKDLAACAQIEGPVTSVYRWKDKVVEDPEYRIVFKTNNDRRKALMDWIKEEHPYEVPEILAWPVPEALPEYAKWVAES